MFIRLSDEDLRVFVIGYYAGESDAGGAVEERWKLLEADSAKRGRPLFNGSLLVLDSVAYSADCLLVNCRTTDFKNFAYAHFGGALAHHAVIFISCMIRAADGTYVFGVNDHGMTIMPDTSIGCVGGTLRIEDNVFDADGLTRYMRSKIECDMLHPQYVNDLRIRGIYVGSDLVNIVFFAEYAGPAGDIFHRGEFKGALSLGVEELILRADELQPKVKVLLPYRNELF